MVQLESFPGTVVLAAAVGAATSALLFRLLERAPAAPTSAPVPCAPQQQPTPEPALELPEETGAACSVLAKINADGDGEVVLKAESVERLVSMLGRLADLEHGKRADHRLKERLDTAVGDEDDEHSSDLLHYFVDNFSSRSHKVRKIRGKALFRQCAKRVGFLAVLAKRLAGDGAVRHSTHASLSDFDGFIAEAAAVTPAKHDVAVRIIESIEDWDFDIWRVQDVCTSPLVFVTHACANSHAGLLSTMNCPPDMLTAFLREAEKLYKPLSYHNALHAGDVVQTCNYFLTSSGLAVHVPEWQKFALILAAAVHDLGHPGLNNAFLAGSSHPLALRYNDLSPLENMHIATAFEIMHSNHHADVLGALNRDQQRSIRESMIDIVLATDMVHHSEHMHEMETLLSKEGGFSWSNHASHVFRIAIHAADVSNPAKEWTTYSRWTEAVMDEFYNQADLERERELKIKKGGFAFLDRRTPIPDCKFQLGFIKGVVQPLYSLFASVNGLDLSEPLAQIARNKARWERTLSRRESQRTITTDVHGSPRSLRRASTSSAHSAKSSIGSTKGLSQLQSLDEIHEEEEGDPEAE